MKKYVNPTLELLKLEAEDVLSTLNSSEGDQGGILSWDDLLKGNEEV